jgi:leucyl aminopeptidase (aminopeptidase T)
MNEIIECAEIALRECLNLKRQEQLLILCDPLCYEIGRAFYDASMGRCKESILVMFPSRKYDGYEPPEPVGAWMSQFDVVVIPASTSFSHTHARKLASEYGARIASLPGITAEMFLRTMKADWRKIGVYTRKIAGRLSTASKIKVKTDSGTDFSFETGGMAAIVDDGRIMSKTTFGTLPAGEAYLSPLENTAEGVLVIDGSFSIVEGLLNEPIILTVKGGKVIKAEGHGCCAELEKIFIKHNKTARTIAEFGVGTNDVAQITGNIVEDKKVRGSVHVAIGNTSLTAEETNLTLHLEGVLQKPSVWLDEKLWIDHGVHS